MQEFLSGSAFEQMAREYNAKYGKANVLNEAESPLTNLTKEKESNILEVEKTFSEIASLFLFLKRHITRVGVTNVNRWGNFYLNKLKEIEGKLENLRQRLLHNIYN